MCFTDEIIDRALPLRTAIFRRCFSHMDSRFSPVFSVIRFPISLTMLLVEGPKTPDVSIATGSNLKFLTRSGYLILLAFSAFSAAQPASNAVSFMELSLKVLMHVASQQIALP